MGRGLGLPPSKQDIWASIPITCRTRIRGAWFHPDQLPSRLRGAWSHPSHLPSRIHGAWPHPSFMPSRINGAWSRLTTFQTRYLGVHPYHLSNRIRGAWSHPFCLPNRIRWASPQYTNLRYCYNIQNNCPKHINTITFGAKEQLGC